MSSGTYQVFARKYRPRTFDEVLGQNHVIQTLRNAIDQKRIAQAYLFVGPRGTGKTTTARILAKALNCEDGPKSNFDPDSPVCQEIGEGRSLDVLEIDGASNNGVNEVRDLRETVQYAPTGGKFRIYYIDEVHMLSNAAFNALLKTLEEPPAHVKFIFATTEPQKILPTILSRCQRFDLRRIPAPIIADHLLYIAKNENVELSETAAHAIAKGADGGMRDAQSMLDQLVAFCGDKIAEDDVLNIFGLNSSETVANIAEMLLMRNNSGALEAVHDQDESGKDLTKLLGDLITHFRHLLVAQVDPSADSEEVSPTLKSILESQKSKIPTNRLLRLIDLLAETDAKMKWAPNKRLHLEIGVIKAIQTLGESNIDDVIALISQAAGAAPVSPASTSTQAASGRELPAATTPVPVVAAEEAPAPIGLSMKDALNKQLDESKAQPAAPQTVDPTPTPAPEPLPAEIPPSSDPQNLSGEALWFAVADEVGAERPLIQAYINAAYFLREEDDKIIVGFPTEQVFYRDSLTKQKEFIEAQLRKLSGKSLAIEMTIDESLTPKPPPEAEPEPEEAPPAPVEEKKAAEPVPATPAEAEPEAHDPLIDQALEKFQATLVE